MECPALAGHAVASYCTPINCFFSVKHSWTRYQNNMNKFIQVIKHAFAIEKESYEDLTDEDKELLDKLARGIVSRRLAAPSIMFLESVKPLNFLGSQVMLFFRPIVATIFPTTSYDRMEVVLEKRQSIEWLIVRIEEFEAGEGERGERK
jgi:hypothetical protein